MTTFPHFTRGQGKLTAEVLNGLIAHVEMLPELLSRLERLEQQNEMPRTVFWAALIGWESIGGGRWKYLWREVIWDDSASVFIEKTGGLSSASSAGVEGTNPAYNALENANDGSGVESGGVDKSGVDYPAGFDLVPIRGDLTSPVAVADAPVVPMTITRGDDGQVAYAFHAMNHHDGTCTAETLDGALDSDDILARSWMGL